MSKKAKLMAALAISVASVCHITSVLAAPTEIYGYKRLEIWDFHENSYDKDGKIRIIPKDTVFDTHGNYGNKNNKKYRSIGSREKVDLMSSASHHSSSKPTSHSSADVTSGASTGIATDVLFDFDMLSNAVILKALGEENQSIDKIINSWNTTTRTVMTKRGENFGEGLGVDYELYLSAAAEAFMNGEDLTFEEFIKNKENLGNKLRHLPYKAKYMLEDGTFGDQMVVSEINALNAPEIKPNNKDNIFGKDLVLNFETSAKWTKSITDIKIGKGAFTQTIIPRKDLVITDNSITIKADKLKLGENIIKINANGYRTVVLEQNIFKSKIDAKLQDKYYINKPVYISNLSKEYLSDINKVVLNGKVLKQGEQWNVEESTGKLKIEDSLFNKPGYYKISIDANNKYEEQFFNIEVVDENGVSNIVTGEINLSEKTLPILAAKDVKLGKEDIQLTFKPNNSWEKSIFKIQKLDIAPGLYKNLEFSVSSGKVMVKQNSSVFVKNGKYTLRVFAKGYKPVDVTVNMYENHPEITMNSLPQLGKDFILGMSRNTFDYDWIDNIKEVYIDGNKLTEWKDYRRAIERLEILKGAVKESGRHTIEIRSTGYNNVIKNVVYLNEDGSMPKVEPISTKPEEKPAEVEKPTKPVVNAAPVKPSEHTSDVVKPEVKLLEVPKTIVLRNSEINLGDEIKLDLNDNIYYKYSNKIREVYLDGVKLNSNYRVGFFDLIIEGNVVKKPGKHTLLIKADEFKDKEFVFDAKENKDTSLSSSEKPDVPYNKPTEKPKENPSVVEKPTNVVISNSEEKPAKPVVKPTKDAKTEVKLLDVPETIVLRNSEINLGDEIKVALNDNVYYKYNNKIREVYIDGVKLDSSYYNPGFFNLIIQGNVVKKPGKHTLLIKADEFKDKEFVFNVKENKDTSLSSSEKPGVPDNKPTEKPKENPSVVEKPTNVVISNSEEKPAKPVVKPTKDAKTEVKLLDVPETIVLRNSEINLGDEIKVALNDNVYYKYNNKIREVYIDGVKLDSSYYNPGFFNLIIQGNVVKKAGTHTLLIKADEFNDKEFSFVVK